MAAKASKTAWPQNPNVAAAAWVTQIGTIVELTESWIPYVSYHGSGPVRALSVTSAPVVSSPQELVGRAVLLALPVTGAELTAAAPEPVIVGFLQPDLRPTGPSAPAPASLPSSKELAFEVRVDGKQVQIEAQTELVLRCGKSRIVLHADGRVVIRGEEIISRATGTNKLRGSTVRVN